jgi:Holliday junction resolvasome RuvABC endonuclease subunit
VDEEARAVTALGVDPGLRCTGWSLLDRREVLDSGSIRIPNGFRGDTVFEMTARFADVLLRLVRPWPTLAVVERYVDQGPERRGNPAGFLVAELAGALADECRHAGIEPVMVTRNEALRAVVMGRRGRGAPSEKDANKALELLGIHLPNQHTRDAAMAAICGSKTKGRLW